MTIKQYAQETGISVTEVHVALTDMGAGVFLSEDEFPLGYQLGVVKMVLRRWDELDKLAQ